MRRSRHRSTSSSTSRVGVTSFASYPTEVGVLSALVGQALPGDVVGLMCHAERQDVYNWITEHGGTADSPEALRDKVRAAGIPG